MTNTEELKPCPFCGTAPKTSYRDVHLSWARPDGDLVREYKIECPECGCYMQDFNTDRLTERWNGLTRLDQCPICHDYVRAYGSSCEDEGIFRGYYIRCDKCGLTTRTFDSRLKARDFWNRRVRP
ncbi:MAG: hypothetical protein II954_05065 [Synergistaceae bacterium]|nr:hypothetical protein [Synergistaceae bacterium]